MTRLEGMQHACNDGKPHSAPKMGSTIHIGYLTSPPYRLGSMAVNEFTAKAIGWFKFPNYIVAPCEAMKVGAWPGDTYGIDLLRALMQKR